MIVIDSLNFMGLPDQGEAQRRSKKVEAQRPSRRRTCKGIVNGVICQIQAKKAKKQCKGGFSPIITVGYPTCIQNTG